MAVVFKAKASDPAEASDKQNDITVSFAKRGRNSFFCSGVPQRIIDVLMRVFYNKKYNEFTPDTSKRVHT